MKQHHKIIALFACTFAASPAVLHASHGVQGHGVQGHGVQGHSVQGQTHTAHQSWLQGARLLGTFPVPGNNTVTSHTTGTLEVLAFQGNYITIRGQDAKAGSMPMRLSPHALVGITWRERRCQAPRDCQNIAYRIVSAHADDSHNSMPKHSDNDDIWLHEVEYSHADRPGPNDWSPACRDGGPGLFVNGRWNLDGSWQPGGYTYSCPSGVIAKCARTWGYKPWKTLSAADGTVVPLRPLHQACTRAARADYCGDGTANTRDGTLIDLFDVFGFNRRVPDPLARREAGFGRNGARWVARERWPRGAANHGAWLRLSTCLRLKEAIVTADDPVLLHVWSRPRMVDRRPPPAHAPTPPRESFGLHASKVRTDISKK